MLGPVPQDEGAVVCSRCQVAVVGRERQAHDRIRVSGQGSAALPGCRVPEAHLARFAGHAAPGRQRLAVRAECHGGHARLVRRKACQDSAGRGVEQPHHGVVAIGHDDAAVTGNCYREAPGPVRPVDGAFLDRGKVPEPHFAPAVLGPTGTQQGPAVRAEHQRGDWLRVGRKAGKRQTNFGSRVPALGEDGFHFGVSVARFSGGDGGGKLRRRARGLCDQGPILGRHPTRVENIAGTSDREVDHDLQAGPAVLQFASQGRFVPLAARQTIQKQLDAPKLLGRDRGLAQPRAYECGQVLTHPLAGHTGAVGVQLFQFVNAGFHLFEIGVRQLRRGKPLVNAAGNLVDAIAPVHSRQRPALSRQRPASGRQCDDGSSREGQRHAGGGDPVAALQVARQTGPQPRRRHRLLRAHLLQNGRQAIAPERRPARQQFVQDRSQRIDVGRGSDVARLAGGLLGCHVTGRAHDGAALGLRQVVA